MTDNFPKLMKVINSESLVNFDQDKYKQATATKLHKDIYGQS
jgi:hypothetical protein